MNEFKRTNKKEQNKARDVIRNVAKRDWSFSKETGSNGIYGLHPYPAKFIPQIPRFLIEAIGVAEDTLIFDPFCGSGTTLIEAQRQGYESIGVDLNPIATLISSVSTKPKNKNLKTAINRCLATAKEIKNPPDVYIPNLDHWFKKPIQTALSSIITAIDREPDENMRDTLRLAISSVIVRVSNQDGDTRYAAVEKNVTPTLVFELFEKNCMRNLDLLPAYSDNLPESHVINRDIFQVSAKDFPKLVSLVICSPPYPNAYEYWLYHKYRMWWLGYDPLYVKEREIGARPHYFKKKPQTPEDFKKQLAAVFSLLKDVCIEGAYVCFVIGDSKIHGEIINNTKILTDVAQEKGFYPTAILPREISSNRKSFNLVNSRLKNENIVVLKKQRKKINVNARCYLHNYNYFPYEKKLALRELTGLPSIESIRISSDHVGVTIPKNAVKKLDKLIYFSSYSINGEKNRTKQSQLETSGNGSKDSKRQSTRYSVHGIHEYKGKFNPQVVRGILNAYSPKDTDTILDPFCGSGTAIVEAAIGGYKSVGWDLNPFAVYLTNAKIQALTADNNVLKTLANRIIKNWPVPSNLSSEDKNSRLAYLKNWFPEEICGQIEPLALTVRNIAKELAPFFNILVSDLLRNYSLQEPSDLRIRRRKSPLPEKPFKEALKESIDKKLDIIQRSSNLLGKIKKSNKAFLVDSCDLNNIRKKRLKTKKFDFAITSPPYATALPYIDTQRLSLVWLGLISPAEIRSTEEIVIGSREASKSYLELLRKRMLNDNTLPEKVSCFCKELQGLLTQDDGFRRQAVPVLLYRYFVDMQSTFSNVLKVLKKSAYYFLVLGTNKTTLGGKTININTPEYLALLAENTGWKVIEIIPLETYKRYGLHAANAVKGECLVILKNE